MGDDFKWFVLTTGTATICNATNFQLHESPMEAVDDADAFVNFANANFGYGHFISSCTQEEIMQVCCPEFNVAMLHQGYMADQEVIIAKDVRRFSNYTGYGNGFQFEGAFHGLHNIQTILTMDATTNRHFE